MKNTAFTFAVGIAVFGTTPESAISPYLALEHCIACPPLALHAVPVPKVELFPEHGEARPVPETHFARSYDFRPGVYSREPTSFAISVADESLAMGYGCPVKPERLPNMNASPSQGRPEKSEGVLAAFALGNVQPRTFRTSFGVNGRCWTPAPTVAAKNAHTPGARRRAIRTHVVRRPTGGFDQICRRNPEAIKCALSDPSVITFRRRLGAKLDQDDTMLVGDFRRFTAGVRIIRSFN